MGNIKTIQLYIVFAVVLFTLTLTSQAWSQASGVDEDRVSLPEGPGSLEGVGENVEIDPNMGLMRWGINIDTPKGFPGVTPTLRLAYASGSGSGILGMGWSLSGLQSIERMAARGVPVYDTSDYFAANGGDELVLTDEDPTGNLTYRQRFESAFIRYTWINPGGGSEGYWISEAPDGTKSYYGADQYGEIVESAHTVHPDGGTFRYHVVDVIDVYGHSMHFEYDNFDSNTVLTTQIEYLFVNDDPQYTINLNYETRDDLLSDCGGGFEEVNEQRLLAITVLAGTEVIREYVMDYEDYSTSGGLSRMTSVETYGVGGELSGEMNPIHFVFEYSRALGAVCEGVDCDNPFIVDMGTLTGGVNLTAGNATLIDINGHPT